jgi:ribosome-associated heat shock protein Hsp15
VKHRSDAARLIEEGRVRLNRQKVGKPHQNVRPNDVLTVVIGQSVRAIRVLDEAARRGPATAARLLYEDVTEKTDARTQELC